MPGVRWSMLGAGTLIMLQLHWFGVVVSRVSVNHGEWGGTAPDPLVWDRGDLVGHRKVGVRVDVDRASLPGRPGFLSVPWIQVSGGLVTEVDVAAWPCSGSLLHKFSSSWSSLHWPADSGDLGHHGVSYPELSILFEQLVGHRLLSEKVVRSHERAHRPLSVSSSLVTTGIEIRQGCRFVRLSGTGPWYISCWGC